MRMKKRILGLLCLGVLMLVANISWAYDQNAFVTTWKSPKATELQFPLKGKNVEIKWYKEGQEASATTVAATSYEIEEPFRFQVEAGMAYYVEIKGGLEAVQVLTSYAELQTVEHWGKIEWRRLNSAFKNCSSLLVKATDVPNLSKCTTVSSMFNGCTSLTTINAASWDVKDVSYFDAMFSRCINFDDDVTNWNMQRARTITSMFENCIKFNRDLEKWKLPEITNYSYMFKGCTNFEGKGVDKWDMSKAENLRYMFNGCTNFKADLKDWKVGNVTVLHGTFGGCIYFNCDISKWDVSNVTIFESLFSGCTSFKADLKDWLKNPNNKAENLQYMFNGCQFFNSNLNEWKVGNVTTMKNLFSGCTAYNNPLNNWDVSKVDSMSYMFDGCGIFNQDLSSWNVSNVGSMRAMFRNCNAFVQDLSAWKDKVSNVKDFNSMFSGCVDFNCDLSEWNVSNCTNFNYMFQRCSKFDQDLSKWKMENAVTAYYMFYACKKFNNGGKDGLGDWVLTNLVEASGMFAECDEFNVDLSNWRTPALQNMNSIFYNCKKLAKGDLRDWAVDNVVDMGSAFLNCENFTSDLSKWKVGNCRDFNQMFYNSKQFKSDLSKWDVSNAENMASMFNGATVFESDLSQWNVSNVTNMYRMFKEARAFNADISGWDVSRVQNMSEIFYNAKKFDCDLGKWKLKSLSLPPEISLQGCGMGVATYSRTLLGWAANKDEHANNIIVKETGIKYYKTTVESARNTLKDDKHWQFEGASVADKSLQLSTNRLKIDKDKRETITVTTEPTAIPPEQITWTTTDENIAVYENGEIVGKEVGKCVIRAQSGTDAERVYDEVYVDVVISVKGIVTLKESYEIPVNETFDFAKEVTINPANATNQKLEWSVVSGGETIIEINATGKALAKSVGEAKIRVKALDGSGVDREIPVKVIEVNATSIEVEPQEIALKAGSSATLRAKFTPSNTTNKNVTWTIADSEYATIDEHTGEVTALEAGEGKVTTITATSEDGGHTSKCRLRILPKEIILPKTLKLSPNQMTMNVRDELPITVTISPSNAQEQDVKWYVSNPDIVEVRDGKIIGKKAGTATVRATAYANPEAFDACRVIVKNVPVTQLLIEPDEFEISLNAPYKVEYSVEPENASDKSVTWESSQPDVIQVDPHTGDLIGKVVTEDWVTVIGTANGGSNITKTCKVKVIGLKKARQIFIPVSVTLNLSEKQTLAVSYEPEDATDRQVIWESNDDEIVQVSDKGVLTARQAGDAEITVSLKNDPTIKSVCKVRVLPRVATTGIALIKSLKLGIGANYTFVAQVLPENATDQLLAWRVEEVTNNAIEFDNLTQTVTGKAAGTAKLIVSLRNKPSIKAECAITVETLVSVTGDLSFAKKEYTVEEGKTIQVQLHYTPETANDLQINYRSDKAELVTIRTSTETFGYAEIKGLKATTEPVMVYGELASDPTKKFSAKITVTSSTQPSVPDPKKPLTGFEVLTPSLTVVVGNTAYVRLKAEPADADLSTLEWTVEDATICTVEAGIITAKQKGETKVMVKEPTLGKEYTVTVTVVEVSSDVADLLFADVKVYPNPFGDRLRITSGELRDATYALYNAQGVMVRTGVLESSQTIISTSDLPEGMYLLRLTAENGVTKVYRVVKR